MLPKSNGWQQTREIHLDTGEQAQLKYLKSGQQGASFYLGRGGLLFAVTHNGDP